MSWVDEKINIRKHVDKNTILSLKKDLVIVLIDKADNNMALICKHFCNYY